MILRTALALAALLAGCSDKTTELVRERTVQISAPEDAATSDGRAAIPGSRLLCDGRACECDNRADDDGDMLPDGFDPECSGAYDDDESSFGTGPASPELGECRDCFWDANADDMDDGCRYPAACLTGEAPVGPVSGSCSGCNVTGRCSMACPALTPNGCDCFGCCRQETSSGEAVYVQFIEGCSTSNIDDELNCPRCTPHETCVNDCGDCELCGKRRRKDLPMKCPGEPTGTRRFNTCDEGEVVCAEDLSCPFDHYCQLGCCRPILVE